MQHHDEAYWRIPRRSHLPAVRANESANELR
jgi:hypothetical protein